MKDSSYEARPPFTFGFWFLGFVWNLGFGVRCCPGDDLQRSFKMARIDRALGTSRVDLYRAASTKTFNFCTVIKCETLSWLYDLSNYDCAMSLLSGANAFSCRDRQHRPRPTDKESAPSHSTSL